MINKKRDAVEKIFDSLKNSVGDGRLHGYSDENISGRLFLAFTTAILHALLENRCLCHTSSKNQKIVQAEGEAHALQNPALGGVQKSLRGRNQSPQRRPR